MNRFLIIAISLLLVSCGTIKPAKDGAESNENKHIVGPNTPSNKYSKMRQKG